MTQQPTFYPLPTVTADLCRAVQAAAQTVSGTTDIFTTCIRTEEVNAAAVTAVVAAVLPEWPVDQPLPAGVLVHAIETSLMQRQAA